MEMKGSPALKVAHAQNSDQGVKKHPLPEIDSIYTNPIHIQECETQTGTLKAYGVSHNVPNTNRKFKRAGAASLVYITNLMLVSSLITLKEPIRPDLISRVCRLETVMVGNYYYWSNTIFVQITLLVRWIIFHPHHAEWVSCLRLFLRVGVIHKR